MTERIHVSSFSDPLSISSFYRVLVVLHTVWRVLLRLGWAG